jgi:hypothetical protein
MAGLHHYKTFEIDSLADGATFEGEWIADDDYKIKRIYLIRKSGEKLIKSTFYFKIQERVYTSPYVSPAVIGSDPLTSKDLDIDFKRGEKLNFVFKNNEGEAIDVFLTFEAEKA